MSKAEWHKSSYSDSTGGNCVEVRETPTMADVRDTQNRGAGQLTFQAEEWTAFLGQVRTDAR
ncbi:uncharacterized protein DUF397 [Murinocardiopsis flavida]|uniref:Uncharacterized protein DUF397 n=1 Tax=Murinocardiopsis flavida TaxID=645275 RepID=A0A2P8DIK6_9ACTN|nr:DUF397 domain-containing protein [Murinocardiopsis flavida]PSK97052.1 uncharacterized protein DUF397 [Murinocardiopsis flavida]